MDSGLIKHWIKELDATVSTQDVEGFEDPLPRTTSVSPPGIHCVVLESVTRARQKRTKERFGDSAKKRSTN